MSHSHHNHGDHVQGNTLPPLVKETTIGVPDLRADDHSGHDNSTGSTGHDMMKMFFHTGYDDTILFEQWKPTEIGGMIGSCVFIFFLAFAYEGLKYYREHLYRRSFTSVQYNTVSVPAETGPVRETQKTVQGSEVGVSCFQEPQLVVPVLSCPGGIMKQIQVVQDRKELNETNGEAGSVQSVIKSKVSCGTCGLEAGGMPIADVRLSHKVKMFSMLHTWQTVLHVVQTIISYFLMLIFMTYNVWLCLAVALGAGVGYFFFGWKKSLVVDITEHCH